MKRSASENFFELEPLEQRILLSGDSLLLGPPTGMQDEPEDAFAADMDLLPSEVVVLSDSDSIQDTPLQNADPYNPADRIDDLFAGLTEENLLESSGSPEGVLENRDISPEAAGAIKDGMDALTEVGRLLEDFDDFGAHLPITKDASSGSLVGFYEILDTRLKKPVFDYFNDATDPPTTDGLVAALAEIPSTHDLSVGIDILTGGYDTVSNDIYAEGLDAGVRCLPSQGDITALSQDQANLCLCALSQGLDDISFGTINDCLTNLTKQEEQSPNFLADQLTKTLISPNGPPLQLPGLQLIDPDTSCFEGQIFWLNFDGADDITYHGPVTIEHIDIPAFKAPYSLAGQEQKIIFSVLEQLQDTFAPFGIIFTTDKPSADTAFSTIYIGGDDSAFSEYGSFFGLAEQVDVGNQIPTDTAFVFSAILGSPVSGIAEYISMLSDIVSHETGRLLGYGNSSPDLDDGPFDAVASTYYSDYQGGDGYYHDKYLTVNPGSHNFEVDGMGWYKTTEWYVDGTYYETDNSSVYIDPNFSWYFSSSSDSIEIKALIWDGGSFEEGHRWYVTVGQPDLTKSSNSINKTTINSGDRLDVNVTVKNIGNASANSGYVYYYPYNAT